MPLTSTQKNCNKILEFLFKETEALHSMDDEIIMQKLSMCQNDFDSAVEKLRREYYIHGGSTCVSLNDKGRDFAELGGYIEQVEKSGLSVMGNNNIISSHLSFANSDLSLSNNPPAKNPAIADHKSGFSKIISCIVNNGWKIAIGLIVTYMAYRFGWNK